MREFFNNGTVYAKSSKRVHDPAESCGVYIASFGAAFSILGKKSVPQYATFTVAAYVWMAPYIASLSTTEINM